MALAIAIAKLVKFNALARSPLRDSVAATSVGIVAGTPMLDLAYDEDSRADVDMNVVMTGGGQFVELQATAEHRPFEDGELNRMIELARGGIGQINAMQAAVLSGRL